MIWREEEEDDDEDVSAASTRSYPAVGFADEDIEEEEENEEEERFLRMSRLSSSLPNMLTRSDRSEDRMNIDRSEFPRIQITERDISGNLLSFVAEYVYLFLFSK